MKLQKPKQIRVIGSIISLALLLAMGTVNAAGNGNGKSNSPNRNTPGGTEEYGASVGVSSTCALVDGGKKFQVTTTITDKSLGDTIPLYGSSTVDYIGKMRGRKIEGVSPYVISGPIPFATESSVVKNTLDLCEARANGSLRDGTIALNSFTSVTVVNSKDGALYGSYCVATDEFPKVVIDLGMLDLDCSQ